MEPCLHDGVYVFASLPPGTPLPDVEPLATFREPEGLSLVLRQEDAAAAGCEVMFRAAWISLTVCSALEAVGLTAAMAVALTERNISCNVVAGAYHDHLFVPLERAQDAMDALWTLQREA